MQKKILFTSAIICATLMLSACGKVLPSQEQMKETVDTVQQKVEEVKDGGQKITGSIKDIMKMGGAMQCMWKDEKSGSNGIAYIDGIKMNSTMFNVPVGPNGQNGEMYTISDGEWVYMWSSLSSQGTKMKMDDAMMNEQELPDVPQDPQMPKETDIAAEDAMEMSYDYDCNTWVADQNLFIPPANITFADMDAMMKQMQVPTDMIAPDMQDMKQVCNMLSGQDKIDCEAQF